MFVQPTPYGWDNSYLLDCKRTDPDKFKAVVLVDPLSDSAAEEMKTLAEAGADGLRVNLQLQPMTQWQDETFTNLLDACEEFGTAGMFPIDAGIFAADRRDRRSIPNPFRD